MPNQVDDANSTLVNHSTVNVRKHGRYRSLPVADFDAFLWWLCCQPIVCACGYMLPAYRFVSGRYKLHATSSHSFSHFGCICYRFSAGEPAYVISSYCKDLMQTFNSFSTCIAVVRTIFYNMQGYIRIP